MASTLHSHPAAEETSQGRNAQERILNTVQTLSALPEDNKDEQRETFAFLKHVLAEDSFLTRRLIP